MGIEISLPDVEESTEPPICGSDKEHSTSAISKSSAHSIGIIDQEKASTAATTQTTLCADVHSSESEPRLDNCNEQYTYAHTLSAVQISHLLRVDVK
jgi:Na+-exporting ATPase